MISIVWWCPKCSLGNLQKEPCTRCGTEYVNSWQCDNCQSVVVKRNACGSCGRKKATTIYNALLVRQLFEQQSDSGHTNMEVLRKYAYLRAAERGIPQYLVEDAISMTLVKLVMHIGKYSSKKGSFRTWAIKILKNEMNRLAAKDAVESGRIEVSLDQEGEDGELVMESVLGYTYGPEDLIKMEDRQRYVLMAKLAEKVFGYYYTTVKGEVAELSLYKLCVQTYIKRNGVTWAAAAARIAGISGQALSKKQERARKKWQAWNGKEKE